MNSSMLSFSQPRELHVLMSSDEVKIRPHAFHQGQMQAKNFKPSGPILSKSDRVEFNHHALFVCSG